MRGSFSAAEDSLNRRRQFQSGRTGHRFGDLLVLTAITLYDGVEKKRRRRRVAGGLRRPFAAWRFISLSQQVVLAQQLQVRPLRAQDPILHLDDEISRYEIAELAGVLFKRN